MKEINTNFEKVAPIAFGYERDTDFSKQVSKSIKTFYLQDKPLDKSQIAALAQVIIFITVNSQCLARTGQKTNKKNVLSSMQ